MHFVKKLGLELGKFVQDDINTYYYINGLHYKTYTVKQNPDVLNYPVNDWEKGKSARELFDMALGKVSEKTFCLFKKHMYLASQMFMKGKLSEVN